ncbi:MAG: apolipoprotein N-acyltransferase [Burkholderiaceae bacterium]
MSRPTGNGTNRRSAWLVLLFGALHGALFALPLGWQLAAIPAQFILFAALWWLVGLHPPARVTWLTMLFGIAHFVVGLAWLFISMNRYGGMPAPMAALAVVLLGSYLALFGALALGAASRAIAALSNIPANGTAGGMRPGALATAALVAGCWGLGEIARGYALTGFPWLSIGYAHIDSPMSGLAPIVGVYGLGVVVALLAVWVVELLRPSSYLPSTRMAHGACALGFGALASGFGIMPWSQPEGDPIKVRLLQGNVPQSMKFDRDRASKAVQDYLQMIEGTNAALTVLPETAFTRPLSSQPALVRTRLMMLMQETGTHIAIGMPLRSTDAQAAGNPRVQLTNSMATLSPAGEIVHRYDKQHLVPFGEYVPFGFAWFVNMMEIPLGEFGRGAPDQPHLPIEGRQIAFNICYEDLFGEELSHQVRTGANVLINVSNIAWFGDSHALPQHLNISRMRAIELGRPMLRATNTGATASIDHKGQVVDQLPTYSQGALDTMVQPTTGMTPFARFGISAPLAAIALTLLFGLLISRVDRIRA